MSARSLLAVVLALAVLAAVPAPAAADCTPGNVTSDDVDQFVAAYNQNTDELPGVLKDRLADERVEVTVTGTDAVYTVVTDGSANAVRVEEGSVDPTLRVTASESVLCDAAASENTAQELVAAYENGEIQVSGVGAVKGTVVEIGKVAYGIGKTLGLW